MILLLGLLTKPTTVEQASKVAIYGTILDVLIFITIFYDKIVDKFS